MSVSYMTTTQGLSSRLRLVKHFLSHELGGGFVMRKNVGHDEIDPAENEASAARRQRLDVVVDKLIT